MSTIWHTDGFTARQRALRDPSLRSLYPSQAWSLYRIAPQCASVLDLGFGSEDSLLTLRQIQPAIRYTGLDLVPAIIDRVQHRQDAQTRFIAADFFTWVPDDTFELVQGWSFVYAGDRPLTAIAKMYACAEKYVLFDCRASYLPHPVIDAAQAYGAIDGVTVPYPILSWPRLREFLAALTPAPASVEFACYYYPVGPHVHLVDPGVPEPFVASIVLERGDGTQPTVWHGREIPPIPGRHLAAPSR